MISFEITGDYSDYEGSGCYYYSSQGSGPAPASAGPSPPQPDLPLNPNQPLPPDFR